MEYIYAGGIICALITAFLLLRSQTPFHRYANLLYVANLLATSYCSFLFILVNTGDIVGVPHLFKTAAPLNFLLPTFAFLYVKAVLKDQAGLIRRDLLHFIPFLLVFCSYFPFYAASADLKVGKIADAVVDPELQLGMLSEGLLFKLRVLQLAVYVFLMWRLILRFNRGNVPSALKSFTQQVMNWLKAIAILNSLQLASFVAIMVMIGILGEVDFSAGIIAISLLVVGLAVLFLNSYLLLNPIVLYGLDSRYVKKSTGQLSLDATQLLPEPGLFEQEQKILHDYFVKQRPFLQKGLSIAEVSVAINLSPRSISFILNSQLGVRFSDYVNNYRIQEAAKFIEGGYLDKFTLASLAEEVGFSSTKTFGRVFKKEFNATPMEYAATRRSLEALKK